MNNLVANVFDGKTKEMASGSLSIDHRLTELELNSRFNDDVHELTKSRDDKSAKSIEVVVLVAAQLLINTLKTLAS